MFVDGVRGVRLDQHIVGSLQVGRQRNPLHTFVVTACGHQPVVLKQSDRQVVLAELVVHRQHDAIDPAINCARARSLVLDGPGNVQRDQMPNMHSARCRQLRGYQVRVGRELNRRQQLCNVVDFIGRFDNGVVRIGLDEEVIGAFDSVRQGDEFLATVRFVRRQKAQVLPLVQQQVRVVDDGVRRKVHAVCPAVGLSGTTPTVFDSPVDDDIGSRMQVGRYGQVGDLKIRMHNGEPARGKQCIVTFVLVFKDVVVRVGDDKQPVVAIRQRGDVQNFRTDVALTFD